MSQQIEIPLSNRARTYGYIIWRKKHDEVMSQLIGKSKRLDIEVGDTVQKGKRVDTDQRRISLGYRLTKSFEKQHTRYVLEYPQPDRLRVSTR